jgi:hypothetical protein
MGVSCTIYTGPVVVVTPPMLSESVDVMKCEKCKRRQMGEGAFCSKDGGKFQVVQEKVKVSPSQWLYDLEEDNNIVDYFSHLTDEGGVEIPEGEIWMTPNDSKATYCKYMNDPCRGGYGGREEDPYQLVWVDGDTPVTSPADMLNEFLEDEKVQAHIEVYRNAGAEVRIMVATLAWCS